MAEFNAGSIEASLELNRDAFTAGLNAAKQQAADFERSPITAALTLDTSKFFNSLQQAAAQAQAQAAASPIVVPMTVTPNVASATAARTTLQGAAKDIPVRFVATPLLGSVTTALSTLRARAGDVTVSLKAKADIASVLVAQAEMQAVVGHTIYDTLMAKPDFDSLAKADAALSAGLKPLTQFIHLQRGAEPLPPLEYMAQERNMYPGEKPYGLWFSPGNTPESTAWAKFLSGQRAGLATSPEGIGFWGNERLSSIGRGYRITVDPEAIAWVRNLEQATEFTRHFGEPTQFGGEAIDWESVARRFAGVFVEKAAAQHLPWFQTWDLTSGAVWDPEAIRAIKEIPNIPTRLATLLKPDMASQEATRRMQSAVLARAYRESQQQVPITYKTPDDQALRDALTKLSVRLRSEVLDIPLMAQADIDSVLAAQAQEQEVVGHTIHIPAEAYAVLESALRAQATMQAILGTLQTKVEIVPGTTMRDLRVNAVVQPDVISLRLAEGVLNRDLTDLVTRLRVLPATDELQQTIAVLQGVTEDLHANLAADADLSTVPKALARLQAYVGKLEARVTVVADEGTVPEEVDKLETAAQAQEITIPAKADAQVETVSEAADTLSTVAKAKPIILPATVDADMLRRATELVIERQMGSANMINRLLSTGYKQAQAILNQLERQGIVGPARGSQARRVLVQVEPDTESVVSTSERITEAIRREQAANPVKAPVDLEVAIPGLAGMGGSEFLRQLRETKQLNVVMRVEPGVRQMFTPEAIRTGQAAGLSQLLGVNIDPDTLSKILEGEYTGAVAKAIRGAAREAQRAVKITQSTVNVEGGKIVFNPVIEAPAVEQINAAMDVLSHVWYRTPLPTSIHIPEGDITNAVIKATNFLTQVSGKTEAELRTVLKATIDPAQVQDAVRNVGATSGAEIPAPLVAEPVLPDLIRAYEVMREAVERGNINGVPLRELRGKLGVLPDLQSIPEALLALQNLLKQLVTYLTVKPDIGSVPGATAELQSVADSEEVKVQTVTVAEVTRVLQTISALQNAVDRTGKKVEVPAVTDAVLGAVQKTVEYYQNQAKRQEVTVGMITNEVAGAVSKTVDQYNRDAKKYHVDIPGDVVPDNDTVASAAAELNTQPKPSVDFPGTVDPPTPADVTAAKDAASGEAAAGTPVKLPSSVEDPSQANVNSAMIDANNKASLENPVQLPSTLDVPTVADVAAVIGLTDTKAKAAGPVKIPTELEMPPQLGPQAAQWWTTATKAEKLRLMATLGVSPLRSSVGPAEAQLQREVKPITLPVALESIISQDALRRSINSIFKTRTALNQAAAAAGFKGAAGFDTREALVNQLIKEGFAQAIVEAMPVKVQPTLDADAVQKLLSQAKLRLKSLSDLQVSMVLSPESAALRNQIKNWQTELSVLQKELDVGVGIQPGDLAAIQAKVNTLKTAIDRQSADIKLGISLDPSMVKALAGGEGGGGGKGGAISDLFALFGFGGKAFGLIGPAWLPKFGTPAGMTIGGTEHLITLAAGLFGSIAQATAGLGIIAASGAAVLGVGIANSLAGSGQAIGDLQKVVSAQQQMNAAAATWGKNSTQYLQAWQQFATVLKTQVNPYVQPGLYINASSAIIRLQNAFDKFTGPAESTSLQTITTFVNGITSSGYLKTLGQYAEVSAQITQSFLVGKSSASPKEIAAQAALANSTYAKYQAAVKQHPDNTKLQMQYYNEYIAQMTKLGQLQAQGTGGPNSLLGWLKSTQVTGPPGAQQFGGLALFQELEKLATANQGTALAALGNFIKILASTIGNIAPQTTGMLAGIEAWLSKTASVPATHAQLTAAQDKYTAAVKKYGLTSWQAVFALQNLDNVQAQGKGFKTWMGYVDQAVAAFHTWVSLIYQVAVDIADFFGADKPSKVQIYDPKTGKLTIENLTTTSAILKDITGMLKGIQNWAQGADPNKVFGVLITDPKTGKSIRENLSAAMASTQELQKIQKQLGDQSGKDVLAYSLFDPKTHQLIKQNAQGTIADLANFTNTLLTASETGNTAISKIFSVRRGEIIGILNVIPNIVGALAQLTIPVMIAGGELISNIAAGFDKILNLKWGPIPVGNIISLVGALAILIRTLKLGTVGGVAFLAAGLGFPALIGGLTSLLGIKETSGEKTVIEYVTAVTALVAVLGKLKTNAGSSILSTLFTGIAHPTTKGLFTAQWWKDILGIGGTTTRLQTPLVDVKADVVNVNGGKGLPGGGTSEASKAEQQAEQDIEKGGFGAWLSKYLNKIPGFSKILGAAGPTVSDVFDISSFIGGAYTLYQTLRSQKQINQLGNQLGFPNLPFTIPTPPSLSQIWQGFTHPPGQQAVSDAFNAAGAEFDRALGWFIPKFAGGAGKVWNWLVNPPGQGVITNAFHTAWSASLQGINWFLGKAGDVFKGFWHAVFGGGGRAGGAGAPSATLLARTAEQNIIGLQNVYRGLPGIGTINEESYVPSLRALGLTGIRIRPGSYGPGASKQEIQDYVNAFLSGNVAGASNILVQMLRQSGIKGAADSMTQATKDISAAMKRLGIPTTTTRAFVTRAPTYTLAAYREPVAAGMARQGGNHYWTVTINNPKPEPAGTSFVRTMQKIKFHGLTPIETLEF